MHFGQHVALRNILGSLLCSMMGSILCLAACGTSCHDVLGGQLASTSRSKLFLPTSWAVCCVEPHDEQQLCLADRQHLCLVTSALGSTLRSILCVTGSMLC